MRLSEVTQQLAKLLELNLDAARAYEQALDEVELPSVNEHLVNFQADHDRHVLELAEEIRNLGETPPESGSDLFGFRTEGFASIPQQSGTESALQILEADEKLTAMLYRAARDWDLPPAAAEAVRRHYEEEQVHLEFIRKELRKRVWVS